MNILLIFFAIPFVVIVISIALQKILNCPILVAAIIFSVILLIGVILSNITLIIASIFYGILSFIVAFISCIISRFLRNNKVCNCEYECNNIGNIQDNLSQNNIQTINTNNENLNTLNTNNYSGSFCGCWKRR